MEFSTLSALRLCSRWQYHNYSLKGIFIVNFINDNIAIGSRLDAIDLNKLKDEGIDAVLNVAKDLDANYPVSESGAILPIEYEKVGLFDSNQCSMVSFLSAVLMLKDLLMRHEKVFVHCYAGTSRSVSVVSAYLTCFDDNYSDEFLENVKYVMNKRRVLRAPSPILLALAEKACAMLSRFLESEIDEK